MSSAIWSIGKASAEWIDCVWWIFLAPLTRGPFSRRKCLAPPMRQASTRTLLFSSRPGTTRQVSQVDQPCAATSHRAGGTVASVV